MKISTLLRRTAIGLAIFASSSLFSVYLSSGANDSRVVNDAGIVRGATQRLVKLELAGKESDKLIQQLDRLVNGLINGDKKLN